MSKLEETVVSSKQQKPHINYEAAKSYLEKLNAHITGLGLIPKFETLKEFKTKQHVKDEIAYNKLYRAYKYFHDNIEPSSGNPPELSTYAITPPTNPEVLPRYNPPKLQTSPPTIVPPTFVPPPARIPPASHQNVIFPQFK